MSGIGKAARDVVRAFSSDTRRRSCRKTSRSALNECKRKLRTYGPEAQQVCARAFVREAVKLFATGTKYSKREGRRYYTGAFAFASRDYIKGSMLSVCLSAASDAFARHEHDTVWRLVALAHIHCPDSLERHKVDELFMYHGVYFAEMRPPEENEPLGRRWSVKHLIQPSASSA